MKETMSSKPIERTYVVYGTERVKRIAKKFNLPYWWTESVIIEYFPCRRFLNDGELWTFDFNIFEEKLVNSICDKHVIIPQYYIAQNIKPEDLSQRTLLNIIGSPTIPLKKEDLFPEGKLNHTAFPYLGNSISMWDPKLNFHTHAVILDGDSFYQWEVAQLDSQFTKTSSWFKSQLFDLIPLWEIYSKLMQYRTQEIFSNPTKEIRKKVEDDYKKLEAIRKPLREEIWKYHIKKKGGIANISIPSTFIPPKLTVFDTFSLMDGKYQVRTHLEPLFYRFALRSLKLSKNAHENFEKSQDQTFALAEMEYSLITIMASASCLESYINFIIQEYANQYKKLKDHKKQWFLVCKFLNPQNSFDIQASPYSDFVKVVDLRNDALHYLPEFQSPEGQFTLAYSKFSYDNAKIAVDIILPMIERLTENSVIPLPRWIEKPVSSGGYWDDAFF